MYQCAKCLTHANRIRILKTDPKTNKRWFIFVCPRCDYESDLELYDK